MEAYINGNEGVVKLLLALEDIGVNEKNNSGEAAFIGACVDGNENFVKLLLAREDLDVNTKDTSGWTALRWAKKQNRLGVVNLLESVPGIKKWLAVIGMWKVFLGL